MARLARYDSGRYIGGELVTLTLADLGNIDLLVTLVRPDGRSVDLALRTLSEEEIFQIRRRVSFPTAPLRKFAKLVDDPSQVVAVPDAGDAAFVKANDEAARRFNYLLILHSLTVDIPGTTDDERIANLQASLGNWAYSQLIAHITKSAGFTKAEVQAAADTFHGNGRGHPAGVPAARLDAGDVAADAA